MKSILLSIHPKYVDKILYGKKTIEVRKSRPKITPPFKCYIYMTAGGYEWQKEPFSTAVIPPCGEMYNGSRMVVAEFTCYNILSTCGWRMKGNTGRTAPRTSWEKALPDRACLSLDEILTYVGGNENRLIYGWNISDLKVYDKPKDLSSFNRPCPYRLPDGSRMDVPCPCDKYTWGFDEQSGISYCMRRMEKPPQSWCYVEEVPGC